MEEPLKTLFLAILLAIMWLPVVLLVIYLWWINRHKTNIIPCLALTTVMGLIGAQLILRGWSHPLVLVVLFFISMLLSRHFVKDRRTT